MAVDIIILNIGTYILNPLIGLMFSVALVVFFWGIVEFIWQANEPAARETGRNHMLWGILGMTIMVSVWSLIRILKNSFGI